jgi:hypothetical protein
MLWTASVGARDRATCWSRGVPHPPQATGKSWLHMRAAKRGTPNRLATVVIRAVAGAARTRSISGAHTSSATEPGSR